MQQNTKCETWWWKNNFLEMEAGENLHIQIWDETQSWDDSFRQVY